MRHVYPFSSVVGQDDLKLALLLNAIDPGIGGVLIRGERGTAKSTVARALASLLPSRQDGTAAPFVELPLGATEDRVVGSLDLTKALHEGKTRLRSGLLAKADGGVLYVDEVNLLADHLVDLLLDAAASGWVTIERDGVSASEAARFLLVGTMNPEEGNLRPQFLDRFGLCVDVQGLDSQQLRMAAVSGRLRFDDNPAAIIVAAEPAQQQLRERILGARARLPALAVTDAHLSIVAALAGEQRLDGIRGDLAIVKTARALAAWQAATEITTDHIRHAARFALPHRVNRNRKRKPNAPPPSPEFSLPDLSGDTSTDRNADASLNSLLQPAPAASHIAAVELTTDAVDDSRSGRRDACAPVSGRASRAVALDPSGSLAINQTLLAAATRGVRIGPQGVALSAADLLQHERQGPASASILFVIDASGSMAVQRRLEIAKAAALSLLESSYRRRDEVALMVFRGEGTDLVLPFTTHVANVERALADVPSGGRTPLSRALLDATLLLRERPLSLLVLFTDGRANVAASGADPWEESLAASEALRDACAGALIVDCETGPIILGRARQLAVSLSAECIPLRALEASDLTVHIQRRIETL